MHFAYLVCLAVWGSRSQPKVDVFICLFRQVRSHSLRLHCQNTDSKVEIDPFLKPLSWLFSVCWSLYPPGLAWGLARSVLHILRVQALETRAPTEAQLSLWVRGFSRSKEISWAALPLSALGDSATWFAQWFLLKGVGVGGAVKEGWMWW